MAVGFYRLSFSLPFFAVAVFGWHRKELFAVGKKDLLICGAAGIFLMLHFFSFFTAVEYTTVASAVILCLSHPIIILLITTIFLKEKTSKMAVVGVLIALTGAAIISGGDYSFAGDAVYGDFMAILGAFFLAFYFLTGRKMRKKLNAMVYIFLVFASCWIAFAVGMVATGTPFLSYSRSDFLYLFALAIICQIGTHAVFNWGLGYVSPLYISTIETGESVGAGILAALIFAEIPSAWQMAGGLITIGGLLFYNYYEAGGNKIQKEL